MKKALIAIFILLLTSLGAGFIAFNLVFLPNTTIDCGVFTIDASLKTSKQIADEIEDNLNKIEYIILDGEGNEHILSLSNYRKYIYNYQIKKEINNLEKSFSIKNYEIDLTPYVEISPQRIEKFIYDLNIKRTDKNNKSQDAYIGYNEETKKFEIFPEKWSGLVIWDSQDKIVNEMQNLNTHIDLRKIGCYETPNVFSEDEVLLNNIKAYEKYNNLEFTYVFGDAEEEIIRETLNISVFYNWLEPIYDENGYIKLYEPFKFNEQKINEYVGYLNSKYTTLGIKRNFLTTTGKEVTLTKSNYGWWLDKETVKNDIKNFLINKVSEEKEAPFKQKAASLGEKDYGNSYVEISIEKQHLWMYENGTLIVDCPVVTGNVKNRNNTPTGVYKLTYKTRNAVLRGQDYETPVSYWMPFNGDIGMHDATWRSNFGGSIYLTNGSHGCVNMPFDSAKIVYENITDTTPIIVW